MPTQSFPQEFIKYAEEVSGSEASALLDALASTQPPVSVRWNPYKTEAPLDEIGGVAATDEVPWNRYGRYLDGRPSFTADPLFHAGLYYVQEASSMFVEHVLRGSVDGEGIRLLDMCAAPGGKTTLYSTLAGPEGVVVANEVIRSRASVLADNVRKWGVGNVVVANNDPAHFAPLREWFDVVAVDAPCSGEGMFRKSPEAVNEWSEDNMRMCAARQRRILADAWEALVPGGLLIYSTCTFNRYENEDNVEWLAQNYDAEDAGIEVPEEWNVARTEAAGIKCFRFFPHRVRGEGFFCAAIRKGGQKGRPHNPRPRKQLFAEVPKKDVAGLKRWVGQPEYMTFAQVGDNVYGYYSGAYSDIRTASESLNALYSGVCMGQLYGGKLKPDHALAMFHDIAAAGTPAAELDIENALRFLRKDNIPNIDALAEGLNLITYRNAPLGWAKRIGHRINNLYPKSLMIISR